MKRPIYFELPGSGTIFYSPQIPCRIIHIIIYECPDDARVIDFKIGNYEQLAMTEDGPVGFPLRAFQKPKDDSDTLWYPMELATDVCQIGMTMSLQIESSPGKILLMMVEETLS